MHVLDAPVFLSLYQFITQYQDLDEDLPSIKPKKRLFYSPPFATKNMKFGKLVDDKSEFSKLENEYLQIEMKKLQKGISELKSVLKNRLFIGYSKMVLMNRIKVKSLKLQEYINILKERLG